MNKTISIFAATTAMVAVQALPVIAQEENGPTPNEQAELLAEEIRAQAVEFGDNIVGLRGALENLPEDMAQATELYDEMIAEVEAILSEVGPDSSIHNGVVDLQATAEQYRDQWTERCEETSDASACARVDLWNERVMEAVAVSRNFDQMVTSIEGRIDELENERPYVIDDMRLGMFDTALNEVGNAVNELADIQSNLQQLGDDVDPELAVD